MRRMKSSMKKAMRKAMKRSSMKKSMRMRRRAMKVSKIARGKRAKSSVFRGTKKKTVGGLKKTDLTRNKYGRVVSKKQSARGSKNKWGMAMQKARKSLNIKGFVAIGGKTKQGQELLKKTRSFYKK